MTPVRHIVVSRGFSFAEKRVKFFVRPLGEAVDFGEILTEKDYPTQEEWDELEEIFKTNKNSKSIIEKLRRGNNFPLKTTPDNPELVRQRIGGMNSILKSKAHRLRLCAIGKRYFDNICLRENPHRAFR